MASKLKLIHSTDHLETLVPRSVHRWHTFHSTNICADRWPACVLVSRRWDEGCFHWLHPVFQRGWLECPGGWQGNAPFWHRSCRWQQSSSHSQDWIRRWLHRPIDWTEKKQTNIGFNGFCQDYGTQWRSLSCKKRLLSPSVFHRRVW